MDGACRGGSLAAGCSAPFLSLTVMPLWACPSGSWPRAETVSSFKESVNIHCHDASDLSLNISCLFISFLSPWLSGLLLPPRVCAPSFLTSLCFDFICSDLRAPSLPGLSERL